MPLSTLYDFTGINTIPTLTCSLWNSALTASYSGAVSVSGTNL